MNFISLLLTTTIAVTTVITPQIAVENDFSAIIDDGVQWLNESCVFEAGEPDSDWAVYTAAKAGQINNEYAEKLTETLYQKYSVSGTLGNTTDYCRYILTLSALGEDPSDVKGLNLLADGIYNSGNIGRQGINGYIWSLIAINESGSDVPKNAFNTVDEIISEITSKQVGGGFTLSGTVPDSDVTALALRALFPYKDENPEAAAAVSAALTTLSEMQCQSGSFASYGIENAESTAQVIIALCEVGASSEDNANFIKDKSAIAALLDYRRGNGFAHIDSETTPNYMATYQSIQALAAFRNTFSPIETATEVDNGGTPEEAFTAYFNIFLIMALIFILLMVMSYVNKHKTKNNPEAAKLESDVEKIEDSEDKKSESDVKNTEVSESDSEKNIK